KAREAGPFVSLYDLCNRIAAGGLNRRVLENLIKAGACDSLGASRAAMMAGLTEIMAMVVKRHADKGKGFLNLFDGEEEEPPLPDTPEWSFDERFIYEKEAIGFFITGHPAQKHAAELREYGIDPIARVRMRARGRVEAGAKTRVAGVVVEKKLHRTHKGDRMAFVTLEDQEEQIEAVIFSEVYQSSQEILDGEGLIILEGLLKVDDEEPKLMVERAFDLDTCRREMCQRFQLQVDVMTLSPSVMHRLQDILLRHPGPGCRVTLELRLSDLLARFVLGDTYRVTPSAQLLEEVRQLLGAECAHFGRLA
ncbi:MAG: hypothetical protein HQM02_13845, partial [Magnetococcales bacterium]|nr:hypothetical protein [Magnetococcales bacterium]